MLAHTEAGPTAKVEAVIEIMATKQAAEAMVYQKRDTTTINRQTHITRDVHTESRSTTVLEDTVLALIADPTVLTSTTLLVTLLNMNPPNTPLLNHIHTHILRASLSTRDRPVLTEGTAHTQEKERGTETEKGRSII